MRYRTSLQAAAALGVVVLTVGAVWLLFNSGKAVAVAAPAPTSRSAASECAALTKAVPQTVDNESRRTTDPSSPLTAAWGDPPITLRCGVPLPSILRPGSRNYDPTADDAYLNGLAWLIEQTSDGYRFTAVQRAVYIEVDVPSAYKPETNPLIDLTNAVLSAIPRNDGRPGSDIAPADGASDMATTMPMDSAMPMPMDSSMPMDGTMPMDSSMPMDGTMPMPMDTPSAGPDVTTTATATP